MSKLLRVIANFSGGLSEVGNDNMKDNELVTAQNAVPGETYGIARAEGVTMSSLYNTDKKLLSIIELNSKRKHSDGTSTDREDQMILFLEPDPPIDGHQVEICLASGMATLASSHSRLLDYFIYGNCIYWVEKYDHTNIYKYDGYQLAALTVGDLTFGGSPDAGTKSAFFSKLASARAMVERNGRWFYAVGDSEVIYSEAGNPLSFYVTNILNVNTPDNDHLTALHTFNDSLLIFKERSVFSLTGVDLLNGTDIKLTRLNVTSGTQFPDTICTVENAVMYLGNEGVYRLYTPYYSSVTATVNVAEKKITSKLRRVGNARAVVWQGVYRLVIDEYGTDSGGNSYTKISEYRYYLQDKAWWGPYDLPILCYAPYWNGTNQLHFGTYNGLVLCFDKDCHYYIDTTTGQPRDIEMVVRTKAYDVVGSVFRNSKVKRALIAARQYATESSDLYIQIKADYADEAYNYTEDSIEDMIGEALNTQGISFDESLVWEEGSWAEERWGWTDTVFKQIPIGRKTKHFQFILKSKAQQPLTIYALGLLYKPKKVKGNADGVSSVEVID